jgi:hypothetical protein
MAKILGQVRVSAKLFTGSLQGSFNETLVAKVKDNATLGNNGGKILDTFNVTRHLETVVRMLALCVVELTSA